MKLPTEIFGEVIVVHTPDELAADQADGFESFLSAVEPSRVVVDMDNTEVLDSSGLTALLDSQDRLRERGGDVKIATNNAHNRKILVEVGQFVEKGEPIAEVGETGNATTPHLHFEIRSDGSPRNPLDFLQ